MSPLTATEAGVITTIISVTPKIIELIRSEHVTSHPGDAPLTDAEVKAALQAWGVSTIAIDEAWKAAHPND